MRNDTPHTPAAIRLRGVAMDFPVPGQRGTTRRVLDGIDLDIPEGRLTAIVGPSGSGKSTLLLCAAGLEQATAGEIEVLGADILSLGGRRRAAFRTDNVGFVFQEYNLVSSLTVEEKHRPPRASRWSPGGQT